VHPRRNFTAASVDKVLRCPKQGKEAAGNDPVKTDPSHLEDEKIGEKA
jgi:hypothetical protein